MIDRVLRHLHDESAEALVIVVQVARAPVVGRGEVDLRVPESHTFPVRHLPNLAEIQLFQHARDPARHDHRLRPVGDALQRHPAEVVEVRVRDQHQVDRREMLDIDPGIAMPFHRPHPLRPDRIDQRIESRRSHEKARVPDPHHLDLIITERSKNRRVGGACRLTLPHHRREQTAAEIAIIPQRPPLLGNQSDTTAVGEKAGFLTLVRGMRIQGIGIGIGHVQIGRTESIE